MTEKSHDEQVLKAAETLEELSVVIQAMVNDLRTQRPIPGVYYNRRAAYARVYWLRRELSRVVASLGADRPEQLQKVDQDLSEIVVWSLPILTFSARQRAGTHPGVMLFGGWVYDCANWPPRADVGRISINTRVPMASTSTTNYTTPVNDRPLNFRFHAC
jgi:hypothetical protein